MLTHLSAVLRRAVGSVAESSGNLGQDEQVLALDVGVGLEHGGDVRLVAVVERRVDTTASSIKPTLFFLFLAHVVAFAHSERVSEATEWQHNKNRNKQAANKRDGNSICGFDAA